MACGISITPSKSYISVQLTPTTKKAICIVCGKREDVSKHRALLYKNDKKSEVCIMLEKYLDINITHCNDVSSVCQNCHRSCLSIQSKLHLHKQNYVKTIEGLRKTHGKNSKKRLPFSDTPMPKRKEQDTQSNSTNAQEKVRKDQPDLLDAAISKVTEAVQNEIRLFCAKTHNTRLRSNEEDLKTFSWETVAKELTESAPTFWTVLSKCAHNPRQTSVNKRKTEEANLPGIASAACKLLCLHTKDLDAHQRMNSIVLLKGGAKQSVFRRLNATHDCLSYPSTLKLADNFGLVWETKLLEWVQQAHEDTIKEKEILSELEQLEMNAVFIDDPVESISNLFTMENTKKELQNHRDSMYEGYYFVGDNVDMRTTVRQMTLQNQNKDQHMYQICAYKNRISGNNLDNTKPKSDVKTVEFTNFLPNENDKNKMKKELAFILAVEWTNSIPHFKPYKSVLPEHIEHPFMKETTTKTERINMGVLQKNEQYNEDMTDICSFLNQYIPGAREEDDTRKPDKVLSGGDYLTFERHKQAQSAKRNGRTPMKRMEGLVPKLEEFHNQAEFLKVMWKVLYCTSSSKDTGTLYAARNAINAKNVSKDPSSNYYASSELVNKFTKAYCVAAALEHFKMETVKTAPTHNLYHGAVGDEEEMKDYILSQAEQVITAFTSLDIPNIPETGYQSNNIVCELCRREFQQATTLERHQLNAHNIDPPPRNNEARLTGSPTEQDYILNYSKVSLTLGLLKLNHDNAICMCRATLLRTLLMMNYRSKSDRTSFGKY